MSLSLQIFQMALNYQSYSYVVIMFIYTINADRYQWMYGGAFQFGSSSENKGNTVVERSIALGEPVIHVSANYRLNGL